MKTPNKLLLWVAGLLMGCDAFDPPAETYRFEPPAVYDSLWAVMEGCSGLRGDMNRVAWFAIPGVFTFPCPEGGECSGLWVSPHSIYLASWAMADGPGGSPVRDGTYFVVRHEMLHDLLGGGEGHPPVFETCGVMRR